MRVLVRWLVVGWSYRALRAGGGMALLGLARTANWYAVKACASRTLRLTRCHERGPGEGLFGQL
jgi:hypothetical protein